MADKFLVDGDLFRKILDALPLEEAKEVWASRDKVQLFTRSTEQGMMISALLDGIARAIHNNNEQAMMKAAEDTRTHKERYKQDVKFQRFVDCIANSVIFSMHGEES